MTIIGKSMAALAFICDALSSKMIYNEIVYVFNNMNIDTPFNYSGLTILETDSPRGNKCVLGAVMPKTKKAIYDNFLLLNYVSLIHHNAYISPASVNGKGCLFDAQSNISCGAVLGNFVTVYSHASIQHDCIIKDFVTVCPGSILCGNVTVGEGTFIGAGSVIKNGITIGKNCVIGCGSVVIRDVEDNKTVYGLVK